MAKLFPTNHLPTLTLASYFQTTIVSVRSAPVQYDCALIYVGDQYGYDICRTLMTKATMWASDGGANRE